MNPWSKLRSLFRKTKRDAEMAEEIRLHLELQTERNIAAGMDPDEARYAAQRLFGGVEQVKERCRDQRSWVWLENAWRDLRLAARSLRRAPAFSLAVITTLALCIGPNTAILTVLYALVLKPYPFPGADRVVQIHNIAEKQGGVENPASAVQYENFSANADLFEDFALMKGLNGAVGDQSTPTRTSVTSVTESFFEVLQVKPVLGRFFLPDEMRPGQDRVFVLTQRYWEANYGADPSIIGRKIWMDGEPHIVVGVAPPGLDVVQTTIQIFKPYVIQPASSPSQAWFGHRGFLIGRLKKGVTLEAGLAQLEALDRRFREQEAAPELRTSLEEAGFHIGIARMRDASATPFAAPLRLLQTGACMVLLIGWVNVTNLFLTRANSRRAELAVRHALGAGRGALLRHMLAESMLLTGTASAVGCILGAATLHIVNRYLPLISRGAPPVSIESAVVGMVLLSTALVALGVGLVPFALVWRSGLKLQAYTASASGRAQSLSRSLVILQVSIALVLLVGAGLLIRSFGNVLAVPPGIDAGRVVGGSVALPRSRYHDPQASITVHRRILSAFGEIPGVEKVAVAGNFGVSRSFAQGVLTLRDVPNAGGQSRPLALVNPVSSEYFETMGMRILEGRGFADQEGDFDSRTPVAIVDQTFAQRYFDGQSAVGREFAFGHSGPKPESWIRIVGVVNRAQLTGLEGRDGLPFVYLPHGQQVGAGSTFLLRTSRPAADVIAEMRQKLRSIDSALPLYGAALLQDSLDDMLVTRKGITSLLVVFAGLAVLLAGIGLYGVLAYDVSQRTREIGIRGALGAPRGRIVGLVVQQGMRQAVVGLCIGLAGSVYLTRFLTGLLFDMTAGDPAAYAGVVVVLLVVALLACWLPARRAAKVDPAIALRCE